MKHALWATAAAALCTAAAGAAPDRWTGTAHGPMLERILPKTITPAQLPEPQSQGARLVARYCVQCHHLPNPPMHTAARWKTIVERMVWRMRGDGNLGAVMKDLMDGVQAPADEDAAMITAYLQRYGQKEMDPGHPALHTEAGETYALACTQCHALPDPQRHTASEWPAVVQRMRGYMRWANTVTGDPDLRTTPELNTADIVRLLQRYARPGNTP
jgi:cytochrome c2